MTDVIVTDVDVKLLGQITLLQPPKIASLIAAAALT